MEVMGMKQTIYNRGAEAVICDTEIMAAAPMRLLRAGFGDMIAKYVSVCEWKTAHIIAGEYYCEAVADMMRTAGKKVVDNVDGIIARDPDAVGNVAEGLVLSGLAMAFANVSRPASGIEHRFSHIWEMINIQRGRQLELHGIQVGIGTVLALEVYEYIKRVTPEMNRARAAIAAFDRAEWERGIRAVFGEVADEVIAVSGKSGQLNPEVREKRAAIICEKWDEILGIINAELPNIREIYAAAEKLGMPIRPCEIGVSDEDTRAAFTGSKDIRDKYICTNMLFDVGLLDDAAAVLDEVLRR
jgi:glycerol-1-phosphate dehydrogenase [NAD(P)+]